MTKIESCICEFFVKIRAAQPSFCKPVPRESENLPGLNGITIRSRDVNNGEMGQTGRYRRKMLMEDGDGWDGESRVYMDGERGRGRKVKMKEDRNRGERRRRFSLDFKYCISHRETIILAPL